MVKITVLFERLQKCEKELAEIIHQQDELSRNYDYASYSDYIRNNSKKIKELCTDIGCFSMTIHAICNMYGLVR